MAFPYLTARPSTIISLHTCPSIPLPLYMVSRGRSSWFETWPTMFTYQFREGLLDTDTATPMDTILDTSKFLVEMMRLHPEMMRCLEMMRLLEMGCLKMGQEIIGQHLAIVCPRVRKRMRKRTRK